MIIVKIIFIMSSLLFFTACSYFDKKESVEERRPAQVVTRPIKQPEKSYSSTPNYISGKKRQYKRTTKETLAEEAKLLQGSGSLWVMQGQGSFLFAQNNLRMLGDLVNVNLDGEPKKELEEKINTIAGLLLRLEEKRIENDEKQEERRLAMLAEREKKQREKERIARGEKKPEDEKDRIPATAKKEKPKDKKDKEEDPVIKDLADFKFDVKSVPTRIKKQLPNGDYRVEGSKAFLLGGKEYRVIIDGIVPSENIDGDKISSTNLVDANFDIVSTYRKGAEL